MKTFSKRCLVAAVAMSALLLVSLLLSACAEKVEAQAEEPGQGQPHTPSLQVIGSETATSVKIEVLNATDMSIIDLSIKPVTEEDYPSSLISRGKSIAKGEAFFLFFEPSDLPSATTRMNDEVVENIVLRPLYDVALVFDDNTTYVLHGLSLEKLAKFDIYLSSEGFAYIIYEDENGKKVSTLETEKALKEQEEAARAEAEAAAAAEAARLAAEAEAEEANSGYSYNYSYSYSSSGGGSSGTQSEEQCLTDPVFRV